MAAASASPRPRRGAGARVSPRWSGGRSGASPRRPLFRRASSFRGRASAAQRIVSSTRERPLDCLTEAGRPSSGLSANAEASMERLVSARAPPAPKRSRGNAAAPPRAIRSCRSASESPGCGVPWSVEPEGPWTPAEPKRRRTSTALGPPKRARRAPNHRGGSGMRPRSPVAAPKKTTSRSASPSLSRASRSPREERILFPAMRRAAKPLEKALSSSWNAPGRRFRSGESWSHI